jgi:hypothetical protein
MSDVITVARAASFLNRMLEEHPELADVPLVVEVKTGRSTRSLKCRPARALGAGGKPGHYDHCTVSVDL